MSTDKEPRIHSRQIEVIVYILQDYLFRPNLYGLGDPRQPTPGRVNFTVNVPELSLVSPYLPRPRRDNSGGRVVSPRQVG